MVWPGTDEEHEVPARPQERQESRSNTMGEKVIVGFGRALRKAVRDTDCNSIFVGSWCFDLLFCSCEGFGLHFTLCLSLLGFMDVL